MDVNKDTKNDNRPIGVYDSGVGGISVLHAMKNIMPHEQFIYYADFANAPYGEKSRHDILHLANNALKYLTEQNVKAVVVACNTATSAAISDLRRAYALPIIGLEPAIKPASQIINRGSVLVLATPATLSFMKFQKLYESYGNDAIVPVACPNLSKLIEDYGPSSPQIMNYLDALFEDFSKDDISAVVIGCTHFSFITDDIKRATRCQVVFDGRFGTARHVKKILEDAGIASNETQNIALISNHEDKHYTQLLHQFMMLPLDKQD